MFPRTSRSDACGRRVRKPRGGRHHRAQWKGSPGIRHVEARADAGRLFRGAGGGKSGRHRCARVCRHWLRRVRIAPRRGLKLALSDNSPFFGNRKQTHEMWAFCFRRGVAHRPVLRQGITLSLLSKYRQSGSRKMCEHRHTPRGWFWCVPMSN